jgi:hypothetical protein
MRLSSVNFSPQPIWQDPQVARETALSERQALRFFQWNVENVRPRLQEVYALPSRCVRNAAESLTLLEIHKSALRDWSPISTSEKDLTAGTWRARRAS